jgi:hypothetical protein
VGLDRGPGCIPHNPVFQGDLLHVAWYYDGYALWSVQDPAHAQLLGYYDTHPEPYTFSYKGAWGVYPFLPSGHVLISDMQRGLYVLDISEAIALGVATHDLSVTTTPRCWPDPATDQVSVQLPAEVHGAVRVDVSDASGRLEHRMNTRMSGTTLTVDVHALPAGTHLLRITAGDRTWVTRVMKTFAP